MEQSKHQMEEASDVALRVEDKKQRIGDVLRRNGVNVLSIGVVHYELVVLELAMLTVEFERESLAVYQKMRMEAYKTWP